jgi:hypothetical protein
MDRKPEYAQYVIRGLEAGKSRDVIALELQMNDLDQLDMYMKRQRYDWYPSRGNYFPNKKVIPSESVHTILNLIGEGVDLKEISRRLQFDTVRQMAQYMKSNGYVWSESTKRYVSNAQISDADRDEQPLNGNFSSNRDINQLLNQLEKILPMLDFLEKNKNSLEKLLVTKTDA